MGVCSEHLRGKVSAFGVLCFLQHERLPAIAEICSSNQRVCSGICPQSAQESRLAVPGGRGKVVAKLNPGFPRGSLRPDTLPLDPPLPSVGTLV